MAFMLPIYQRRREKLWKKWNKNETMKENADVAVTIEIARCWNCKDIV